jgi:hypothetical protein
VAYRVYSRNLTFNPVEQVLYNRGIASPSEMDKLIHPTAESVHSPYLLNNIEWAVRAVLTEIVLGHRVHI